MAIPPESFTRVVHAAAPCAGGHHRVVVATVLVSLLVTVGCRTRLLELAGSPVAGEPDLELASLDAQVLDAPPPPPDYNFPPLDLTLPQTHCGVVTIQTTQVIRAELLVVQDRSRSMSMGPDGASAPVGQRKWDLVVAAIKQVVAGTTSVDWGLMLYGSGVRCGVSAAPEVPVGPDNAARVRQVLDSAALTPTTPTAAAIRSAAAWLQKQGNLHPHYLLLATDGQPTCPGGAGNGSDGPGAIAAVRDAVAAGVSVFVVGIGNSNAEDTLAAMAQAGGVPNRTPGQPAFFQVSSTQDLVKVLEAAALRITPCTYPLAKTPPAPERVTIQGRGGVIQRDLAHLNGWDYSDGGVDHVTFYGDACNQLKLGVVLTVDAIFGCPGDGP